MTNAVLQTAVVELERRYVFLFVWLKVSLNLDINIIYKANVRHDIFCIGQHSVYLVYVGYVSFRADKYNLS